MGSAPGLRVVGGHVATGYPRQLVQLALPSGELPERDGSSRQLDGPRSEHRNDLPAPGPVTVPLEEARLAAVGRQAAGAVLDEVALDPLEELVRGKCQPHAAQVARRLCELTGRKAPQ